MGQQGVLEAKPIARDDEHRKQNGVSQLEGLLAERSCIRSNTR